MSHHHRFLSPLIMRLISRTITTTNINTNITPTICFIPCYTYILQKGYTKKTPPFYGWGRSDNTIIGGV